jgi:hypothetical protein
MSKVPPMTSESGKNASGQEAFGSKIPDTSVVESPAASAADVTSAAAGAGMSAAPEADQAGTSAPPTTGGEGVLTDKRRIPLQSASVRTPHLFHHGIPKVLVNPRSKGITSVRSTTTH